MASPESPGDRLAPTCATETSCKTVCPQGGGPTSRFLLLGEPTLYLGGACEGSPSGQLAPDTPLRFQAQLSFSKY